MASDVDSYVALAAEWGNAPNVGHQLGELRRNMRAKLASSSVCDTATFAREMEKLFVTVQAGS